MAQRIIPVYIDEEVQRAYLDYAMSVIVSRAIPDVRDGLKPVQRRIIYVMGELGLYHDKPFKKSAAVVGEVLGKYHPHGDSAIYDALVRMAQDFSLRYPLVDGQGNFGSIDGDSAAAYRYTEARLSRIAEYMLQDLDKDTVDFVPNFDGRLKEPTVLPSAIPNLLLNGASGIAVGMATSIPPHNIVNTIDALVSIIDNPDISVEEVFEKIKGPDFPTGGYIAGKENLKQAYITGRGKIVLRGKVVFENEGKKERIVIKEIPYQVNKSALISKIASLVKAKKIEGISDLRDESDREGMRIVIELKRGVDKTRVLNLLYRNTQLQVTYPIILLALVDGVPRVLNIKEMGVNYIEHRYNVVERRSKYLLNRIEERINIIEGLKIAIANIDEVVKIIKGSKNVDKARSALIKRFKLNKTQAQAILEMRLQKLTSLEIEKLEEEYKKLLEERDELRLLLSSRFALLNRIKKELLEIKELFKDRRRTEILEEVPEEEVFEEKEEGVVFLNTRFMTRYLPQTEFDKYVKSMVRRTGAGEDEFPAILIKCNTEQTIFLFTQHGHCFSLPVSLIKNSSSSYRFEHIKKFISTGDSEIVSILLPDDRPIFLLSSHGNIKRMDWREVSTISRRGARVMNLRDGEEVVSVFTAKDDILLYTYRGMALRMSGETLRSMGRSSGGVKGISPDKGDRVMGGLEPGEEIIVITENGYLKRIKTEEIRRTGRGGKGVIILKFTEKTGGVKGVVSGGEYLLILTDSGIVRIPHSDIKVMGRNTMGTRMVDGKVMRVQVL